MFDWITDFFKALFDLIPKIIYLLYASLACVIDLLQLFFRKLAGLDVYYVDGQAIQGDIVTNFITGILGISPYGFEYSALTTVFYSFIIFGIVICFMSTIVAIIKSHYTYDDKSAKGPMQYVYTGAKAVLNMVAVPIIVVLGLYMSQAILTALDSLTSITSGSITALYGQDENGENVADVMLQSVTTAQGKETFIYYDIFGFSCQIQYGPAAPNMEWLASDLPSLSLIGSANQTFSGSLFRVAAYNANRVRISGSTNMSGFDEGQLFENGAFEGEGTSSQIETAADMVDTAFANNLHLKDSYVMWLSAGRDGGWVSLSYFTNFLTMAAGAFSKFNVGAVWYYYDLWTFNFLVGFAGIIICTTLFINIIMGLMARIFMCIALFLVAPPLFGLAPLDGGKAGSGWRENFMKQVLMAYGSVVGMNVMFLILPYMNTIDFFNIPIADLIAQSLLIIVGLITIKSLISVLSGLIGAADANETGEKISKEVGSVAGKATAMTVGAAKLGAKATGGLLSGIGKGAGWISDKTGLTNKLKGVGSKISNSKFGKSVKGFAGKVGHLKDRVTGMDKVKGKQKEQAEAENKVKEMDQFDTQEKLLKEVAGTQGTDFDAREFREKAKAAGFSGEKLDNMVNAVQGVASAGGKMKIGDLRKGLQAVDSKYNSGIAAKWNTKKGNEAERKKREDAVEKARKETRYAQEDRGQLRRVRLGRWGIGVAKGSAGLAGQGLKKVDSVFKGSDLYSQFKEDSFWKKPNYEEQTANNTKDILSEMQGGREDMRAGFGAVHDDIHESSRLADANANKAEKHLRNIANKTNEIQQDTIDIKQKTARISRRTKLALNAHRKAKGELEDANKRLDKVVKTLRDIDRKT